MERGLPAEMAFMRACGAFAADNSDELTLTPKGRYLVVVMMRQFFIGVNNLRDQARAALTGEERELVFGDGTAHGCAAAGGASCPPRRFSTEPGPRRPRSRRPRP